VRRAVDLLTPLGRGQRGLIVAPPRVGKTILLRKSQKRFELITRTLVLICPLVDERPKKSRIWSEKSIARFTIRILTISVQRHVQVAEMVLEQRPKRLSR